MANENEPATKQDILTLKQDIADLRSATQQDIADLRSATQQDIAELRSATQQDIAELRAEMKQDGAMLRSEMQHIYDALVEHMDGKETKLLNAFYSFAGSNQRRLTETERDAVGLKDRLAIVESRLTEVEKRLNMPPAA